MRRQDDDFGQQELVLVYIAKRLRDAKRIEQAFTDRGIDYLVEADTYRGGFIFQSERIGAFFYVADADDPRTRTALVEMGYEPYKAPE